MHGNSVRWCRVALLLVLPAATACATAATNRYRAHDEDWRAYEVMTREADVRAFEGSAVLQRRDLVRLVLARNPNVRAARHAWRAALARYPQVTALEDPKLGLGLAPRSIGSSRVDDAPKFDLSQKLPVPGKLRLRGEAALAEADAAAHDHAAVRLRLATMASLLYDDYALAARAREINAEHVALLEGFRRIASARYEAGRASQQDPIQAEVGQAHALHREVVLETAERIAAEQINTLLHRPPRAPLPAPPPFADAPPGLAHAEPDPEAVDPALDEVPEVAAAAARVEAEESRLGLARREYFPDVTLVGSYNRIWQERDLQPFVGIQLDVPLQLTRRRAAVEEAKARLEAARSRRRAAEDDARFAVESGVDRLAEARHVAALYRERLLPAASDQVQAARAGFETGRNSFLALIDAERNRLDVSLGYAEALANLGRRRAELDRARGHVPGLDW